RSGFVLAALALYWSSGAAPGTATSSCFTLRGRSLEVCTAYVVNASLGARVPYYKLARDGDPARVRLARFRLESRYAGRAAAAIEQQVRRWPPGRPDVEVPRISILSVAVSAG